MCPSIRRFSIPRAPYWHLNVVCNRGRGNRTLYGMGWGIWTAGVNSYKRNKRVLKEVFKSKESAFVSFFERKFGLWGGGFEHGYLLKFKRQGVIEASNWSTHNTVVGLPDWRLTGWLPNRLNDSAILLTDCLTNLLTDWLTDRQTDWLLSDLLTVHWRTDWLAGWHSDWLTDCRTDRLSDRPTDWLNNWPTD